MQDVYIGFSKTRKWFAIFSWLIRLFERTPYSHVYLSWTPNSIGTPVVYEASGAMLKFLNKNIFDKKNKTIESYRIVIDNNEKKALVKWCLENAGVDYGFTQLFGIALQRIFNLSRNPLSQGRKSQVCSELVGSVLEEVFGERLELDLDVAGPKDIREWCVKNLERVE